MTIHCLVSFACLQGGSGYEDRSQVLKTHSSRLLARYLSPSLGGLINNHLRQCPACLLAVCAGYQVCFMPN